MRNLKKILALVLALVMSLSLMATASAAGTAAVTDAATAYKTAVDVLTGLKVVIGDAGGIRENDPITRAEAATLIYRVHTADVTDSKVYLHTDHPFTDVASTSWMNSYVSYAHNAQIVKGKTTTTFDPTANITGYETLAMTLRALGYGKNGEFEGSEWKIQTAAWSQRIGLFSGISAADSTDYALNQPASRGFVFQVMFNAVLMDQVAYSAYTPDGYSSIGTSMADGLKLTKVEGVVTANEYADLYDTTPLADGKTKLGDYTIDYTTNFDDLGESKLAYLHDGKTVLTIADSGKNSKAESTDEEKNLTRILGEAGISTDSETERFINFGQGTNWTSGWKIKYVLTLGGDFTAAKNIQNDRSNLTDLEEQAWESQIRSILSLYSAIGFHFNLPDDLDEYVIRCYDVNSGKTVYYHELTYTVEYRINEKITPYHQQNIEEIFNVADKSAEDTYITGEVYVGTTSMKDISDEKSFDQFLDEYINETDEATVSANERGNWLKVIDNDGDGKADYILKVIYTMAQVTRVKDDVITLDVKNRTLIDDENGGSTPCADDAVNNLTSQSVTTKDDEDYTEPAAGDVVYYAIIDGNAFAYLADMEVATFEEVNRNTRVATTVDGTEWTESQICEHIVDEAYMSNITALAGKVSYDVYFDRGGYIAAFAKTEGNDFVLITDGWFNSTKNNGYEYAVKVYNAEADEQNVVDLDKSGSLFISGLVENNGTKVQNNDWSALKYLGGVNESNGANDDKTVGVLNGGASASSNRIKTTVAAISGETILPVEDASASGRYARNMIDMGSDKDAIPSSAYKTGRVYTTSYGSIADDTAYNAAGGVVEVRALSTTTYYVVYPLSATSKEVGVKVFTGYGSVPSSINDRIEDVYAVATRNAVDNDLGNGTHYYTANIVVIELNAPYPGGSEVVFLVDDEVSMSNVSNRPVRVIGKDGKEKTVTVVNRPNASGTLLTAGSTQDTTNTTYKWAPGLYTLTETSTKGEYTLAPLSTDDIRKNNFVIGMVQYVEAVGEYDYVTIIPAKKVNGEFIPDPSSKGTPYKINSDALWTLGYGVNRYGQYLSDAAEAELSTIDWALRARRDYLPTNTYERDFQITDHSAVNGYYNYNRVLIKHDGDGNMVYAISFDNLTRENGNVADYAREIWENCYPGVAASTTYGEPTVTFYGVTDGEKNSDGSYKDLTNTAGDHAITVSFETASNAAAKTIVVSPAADKNAITRVRVNSTIEVTNPVNGVYTYTLGALASTATTYTVEVFYNSGKDTPDIEIWTLTVSEANNDTTVQADWAKGIAGADADGVFNQDGNRTNMRVDYPDKDVSIENFEKSIVPLGENAAITFTYYDKEGVEFKAAKPTTTAEVGYVRMTVKAESGRTSVSNIVMTYDPLIQGRYQDLLNALNNNTAGGDRDTPYDSGIELHVNYVSHDAFTAENDALMNKMSAGEYAVSQATADNLQKDVAAGARISPAEILFIQLFNEWLKDQGFEEDFKVDYQSFTSSSDDFSSNSKDYEEGNTVTYTVELGLRYPDGENFGNYVTVTYTVEYNTPQGYVHTVLANKYYEVWVEAGAGEEGKDLYWSTSSKSADGAKSSVNIEDILTPLVNADLAGKTYNATTQEGTAFVDGGKNQSFDYGKGRSLQAVAGIDDVTPLAGATHGFKIDLVWTDSNGDNQGITEGTDGGHAVDDPYVWVKLVNVVE